MNVRHASLKDPAQYVGKWWRPWNVDALALVMRATPDGATIAYDHAPRTPYTLTAAEFIGNGRIVDRAAFERNHT